MDIYEILDLLPQKYPFLLVDKIVDIEKGKRIVGVKNVTINEPFFQGHIPNAPVMPASMILESMSQVSAILFLKDAEYAGRFSSFESIKNVIFLHPVKPGDCLRLEMEVLKIKDSYIDMKGIALVDGRIICEGEIRFSLNETPSKSQIHPTASVHSSAILGKDVIIGPYTKIGQNVVIGDRTVLESSILVEKWTKIGSDCHIHFGAVLGSSAQDIKYDGEKTWVVIGDRNIIREYVTINRSTGANTITEIGNDNILLTNVHIAHNCKLGNNIIIANMTNIAGHTVVEDKVTIGGMTGVHQFCRIGEGAMVGAYTRLPQDTPPFMLCEGNPAIIRGVNLIGLKRRGVSREGIKEIRDIHKLIYRSEMNTSQAMEAVGALNVTSPEAQHLVKFLQADSHRGFTKKTEA